MKLLIIRHAVAEDKDVWTQTGASDDDRPLTAAGRAKMARNARGLHTLVTRIAVLATSPLVRARQTADIVAAEYGIDDVETTDTLIPTAPLADFATWVAGYADAGIVAVVGHEPHLGNLATWLLTGVEESHIEIKKGAACFMSFGATIGAGSALLRWSLAPGQLKALTKG